MSSKLKRKMIRSHILALRTKVDSHMCKLQARCKHDYDRRVCETPHFTPNTYVFLDYQPLRANSDSLAKYLLKKEYDELQSRTPAPFRIISVQDNTITIDGKGIPSTISTDQVTHA